jgi:hypothetical protein
MQIGTIVMDVSPPRASVWRKSVRRNLPTGRRALQSARNGAETVREEAIAAGARGTALAGEMLAELKQAPQRDLRSLPASVVLPRVLIPGWVQIYCGQTHAGVLRFLAFLLPLCLAAATIEYRFGGPLLGMAFGIHASSVVSIVLQYFQPKTRASRFAYAMITMLILIPLVYIPAACLLAAMLHVRVRWTWMV